MQHPLITYKPADEMVLVEDVSRNLQAAFREQYRLLYPGIAQNMRLAGDWVEDRLIAQVCREASLPRETYDRFLSGDPACYDLCKPKLLEYMGKSQDEALLRKLDKRERSPKKGPDWAAQGLHEQLLAHCFEAFFSRSTWDRFRTGEKAPDADTLEAIRQLLALTPEEMKELQERTRKEILYDGDLEETRRLTTDYWSLWRKKNREQLELYGQPADLKTFEVYSDVSPRAMETLLGQTKEEPNRDAPATPMEGNSSQSTLLKLNIAFEMDRYEGPAYMASAKTGYFTRLDFLFLTFLYLEFYELDQVQEILQHYARAGALRNPYEKRQPKQNWMAKLETGKPYTREALAAILGAASNQDIQRRLQRRKISYTLTGWGKDAVYVIEQIPSGGEEK